HTNASIRFAEPYLFDQPYSFSGELYLRDRQRENYDDNRLGTRIAFGKRFDYVHSAQISFRAEQIHIENIDDPGERAPEIVFAKGYSTLTSIGLNLRRDTTNRGLLHHRGTATSLGVERFGALGGDYDFTKLTVGWDGYI